MDEFVKTLNIQDYEINKKENVIFLTDDGIEKVERFFELSIVEIENSNLNHHVNQSLRANYMMTKDKEYIVQDDEVIIIDEFTGRIAEGRRYSDGLHQALEAKEAVKINPESKSVSTITYQNLFKLYSKLSGMSGTCKTEEEEIREVYGVDVIVIPTNKKIKRIDKPDKIFENENQKIEQIIKDITQINKIGNPILICTQSIKKSEEVALLLKKNDLKFTLLNAKHIDEEEKIIEKAGTLNSITIGTNMSGRGTNVKISKEVEQIGGLKVIGYERFYSKRVDDQLIGRAGRQGQQGESQFYVSLDDEIFKLSDMSSIIRKKCLNKDKKIDEKKLYKYINKAQKKIESIYYDERKNIIKFDDIINKQRQIIYKEREAILNEDIYISYTKEMIEESLKEKLNSIIKYNNFIVEDFEENLMLRKKLYVDIFEYLNNDYLNMEYEVVDYNKLLNENDIDIVLKYLIDRLYNILGDRVNQNKDFFEKLERIIILPIIDRLWIKHIDKMVELRREASMASLKQQDPFQVYQIQGGKLFNELIEQIRICYIDMLFKKGRFIES
ncbi:MAG: helicase-related protein [Sarcina sp.]